MSTKDAKETANAQSQRSAAQRRRERRAEESRAEAEATVEQIRRHHRSIGSLFSRGAATVTISANAEGVAPARPAAGNQEHGADTTDEPDLTSTLRGSNPQRFAARGGDNRLATLNSDEDEQDVDDATPKHLDPRSRIGAIAERMLSLHILAFAVRYRARRYA